MSDSLQTKELLTLLNRFKELRISVIGDLILDHYIWGDVSRISPEAPVVVVNVTKEEHSLGGAANVAKNIVALGGRASAVGVVGDDLFGDRLKTLFEESGIETGDLVLTSDRSTTVKSRVLARSQQVVRVDRESAEPFPKETEVALVKCIEKCIDSSSGVVLSDYAKGVVSPATYAPLADAFAEGAFQSASKPFVVDPKNANFDVYRGATVVKPNRTEAEAASGMQIKNHQDAFTAAEILLKRWQCEHILITLGELGMISLGRAEDAPRVAVPTQALEVYDVSGAGDTVAAVYCLALAAGGSVVQAAQLANVAAGVVVAEVGAVAITLEQLQTALLQGEER